MSFCFVLYSFCISLFPLDSVVQMKSMETNSILLTRRYYAFLFALKYNY